MQLKQQTGNLQAYLTASGVIDFDSQADSGVRDLADKIAQGAANKTDYIKNAYEFVRDNILHSADINQEAVT